MANTILQPDARGLADEHDAEPVIHHVPNGFSDRFALGFTKLLRFIADTFFAKRYGHRAIVLEMGAAVPGMVGGMFAHLGSLRRMRDDEGWIRTLLEEAENERMHLMTFIEIAKPTLFERLVILGAQWVFLVLYSILYLVSARTAHRVVGYFEEEAVISYALYLKELDEGRSPNVPAPAITIHYWKMAPDATLRRHPDRASRRSASPRHQPWLFVEARRLDGRSLERRPLSGARRRSAAQCLTAGPDTGGWLPSAA